MRKEMQQYLCTACIEDLLLICRGGGYHATSNSSTCVLPAFKSCCWFIVGVSTTLPTAAVSEWHGGLLPVKSQTSSLVHWFLHCLMTTWPIITWRKKTDKLVGSHKKNIIYIKYSEILKNGFHHKSLWNTHTNAITQKLLAAEVKWG
jgi:hypothetical protein